MELEKFEEAKKIKDKLENLERQKRKLEQSLNSCSVGVTINYTTGGAFPRKGEVGFYNKELIKEMISKQLDKVEEELVLVKEEFKNV